MQHYIPPFVLCMFLVFVIDDTPVQSAPIFVDPIGDTFGDGQFAADIALLDSVVSNTDVTFIVQFHNDISPPSALAENSVVGFIDIDVDQSFETGEKSNQSKFSPAGPSGVGTEFYVDLFSEEFSPGSAEVVDATTATVVGAAPIQFGSRELSVTLSLALLGHDDGLVNYGVIVGDFISHSDEATNFGEGVAFTVPEPTFVILDLAFMLMLLARRRSQARKCAADLGRYLG